MNSVSVEHVFSQPPARVWSGYTDHEGWSRWAGLGRVRLVREGKDDRDGVGAVRAFSNTPGLLEEVVLFEAPTRMHYRVTQGPMPFDQHLGEVTFEPAGAGTRVTWRVSFRCRVPGVGWMMERGLAVLFRRILASLGRELDRG